MIQQCFNYSLIMFHVTASIKDLLGLSGYQGNARGDIKTSLLTLSAVAFLVCKVFPSVQLGMKRHAEALLKRPLEWR